MFRRNPAFGGPLNAGIFIYLDYGFPGFPGTCFPGRIRENGVDSRMQILLLDEIIAEMMT